MAAWAEVSAGVTKALNTATNSRLVQGGCCIICEALSTTVLLLSLLLLPLFIRLPVATLTKAYLPLKLSKAETRDSMLNAQYSMLNTRYLKLQTRCLRALEIRANCVTTTTTAAQGVRLYLGVWRKRANCFVRQIYRLTKLFSERASDRSCRCSCRAITSQWPIWCQQVTSKASQHHLTCLVKLAWSWNGTLEV